MSEAKNTKKRARMAPDNTVKKARLSLTDKRVRYGTFSTLICVLFIGLLIVLNFVVSTMDIRFDLTLDKRYTISDESKEIIGGLNENVVIYALIKAGDEDMQYGELLEQYTTNSRYIKTEYIDPYMNPAFVDKYRTDNETIPSYSIIVESKSKFKVITAGELFTREMDFATGEYYIKSFDLEPRVTNAIRYVTGDITTYIYQVTNHNESLLPDSIRKQISMANYEIAELNLFEQQSVPEDADMLIMTTPARDYSPDETQKVLDYLFNGGRAMIFADTTVDYKENFLAIIDAYCVVMGDNIIIEGNAANSTGGMPYILVPNFANHDILNNLGRNTYVLMEAASSLTPSEVVRNSVKIEPLLITSNQSYAKSGEPRSLSKEPNDEEGPFAVAVAVTDTVTIPKNVTTKLIIAGSSSITSNAANMLVSGGNGDFILNAVDWLIGRDDTVYIRPKVNFGLDNLVMNDLHRRALQICSMFVLPGVILVVGIIVRMKRRNR